MLHDTPVGDTIAEILPSIVITLINMVAPMLIKIFVRLERWSRASWWLEREARHSL